MRAGCIVLVFVSACVSAPPRAANETHRTAPPPDAAESVPDASVAPSPSSDAGLASASTTEHDESPTASDGCPEGSVLVEDVCVDRWEAALVEIFPDGHEEPFPHWQAVDGHAVRAVSRPGVFPQTYVSEVQAEEACEASGKRLCTHDEWKTACMGPEHTLYPYGAARAPGTCQDNGRSPVAAVFGSAALAASTPVIVNRVPKQSAANATGKPHKKATTKAQAKLDSKKASVRDGKHPPGPGPHKGHPRTVKGRPTKGGPPKTARPSARPAHVDPGVWAKLNDPRLGQVEGAAAKTGAHAACTNAYGVYDMMGNVHEWVAPSAKEHGTFAGGYFLDTSQNGEGCNYRTQAHAHDYHDYSTGFRCCADR